MALNLVQVVLERTEALRRLEEAYDAQSQAPGGCAAVLESVVEDARARGFCGSPELAAGLLQRSGRFLVEKSSAGRKMAIRTALHRSTALVPVNAERRTTALVPVSAGPVTGIESFFRSLARG